MSGRAGPRARYVKGVVPELTRNLQIKRGGQTAT